MGLGDGKAVKEAQDIKEELGFMYDAITSLGDKLVASFEDAVDGADGLGSAMEIVSKTFQRGLAADLKQSVKNTDALIDLYSKLTKDTLTQKDIANAQSKIDENRLRIEIKKNALGRDITKQQKEMFSLQEAELGKQQQKVNEISKANDDLQKQKGLFQLIQENASGVADKIDKSGTLSKALSGNLSSTLTPLRIFELVVVGIVDAFLSLDTLTAKLAENLGISYHEAANMTGEFSQIAKDSNNIFVTTKGITESQIQLTKALGTNAMFTQEMLITQTELTHQLGLSAETSGEIAKLGLLTGKTSKEIASNVLGQSVAMNAVNGTALTEQQILKDVAGLSSEIQLSMANNPIELAKAVQVAKQFGMELSAVDGIAGGLLNFEQSIGAELEAELLLGKDINLEKARQAALNNDLATVAEEIAKQAGSAAEFTAMNRIQQEALAKAVGMSRGDLAKSLQDREVLVALGAKEGTALEAYNNLKAKGFSDEAIASKLGDKNLANSLHQESIQARFAASLGKVKELFVQIAGLILPIVEPIADAVGFMASLISKSMVFLKILGGIGAAFQTIKFLGNNVHRTQILTNLASKLGLITATQKGTVERFNYSTQQKSEKSAVIQNAIRKKGLLAALEDNIQKKLGLAHDKMANTSLLKRLGLYIKQGAIKAKDFVVEKAGLAFQYAKNAATVVYNAILSIGNAIKKSGLLASIAGMAMTAFSSLSAIPFIGPILGIAGAAAALGLGYMYYNKADDMMSPGAGAGGYGSRTLTGPEGAIALNNKDTVIAGTDLFAPSKPTTQAPAPVTNVVQDNSKMEALLTTMVNKPDPVIEMAGDKLGTAISKYAYSTQ